MFKITDNDFLNKGVCKYSDEYGNTVFMRRDGNGFTGKLRFSNKDVVMAPIKVDLSKIRDEMGANLKITCQNGARRDSADISGGISGFTELVQRWITMISDIALFQTDKAVLLKLNPQLTEEAIWKEKTARLVQYEELKDIFDTIFA